MRYSLHTALTTVDPKAYGGWEGWLNGPVVDASSYGGAWTNRGPLSGRALINEKATLAGHREAVLDLAALAHPGDEVLLHHSHHGGRQDHGIFGGYHETFCLFDGELLDVEFVKLLAHFRPGVAVIVDIDSCHSGGMDRGILVGRSKARPYLYSARAPKMERGDAVPIVADVILRAACRAEETCIEVPRPETERVHGAWTWCLSEALITAATFGSQFQLAAGIAAREFTNQHPRLLKLGLNPDRALALPITP